MFFVRFVEHPQKRHAARHAAVHRASALAQTHGDELSRGRDGSREPCHPERSRRGDEDSRVSIRRGGGDDDESFEPARVFGFGERGAREGDEEKPRERGARGAPIARLVDGLERDGERGGGCARGVLADAVERVVTSREGVEVQVEVRRVAVRVEVGASASRSRGHEAGVEGVRGGEDAVDDGADLLARVGDGEGGDGWRWDGGGARARVQETAEVQGPLRHLRREFERERGGVVGVEPVRRHQRVERLANLQLERRADVGRGVVRLRVRVISMTR